MDRPPAVPGVGGRSPPPSTLRIPIGATPRDPPGPPGAARRACSARAPRSPRIGARGPLDQRGLPIEVRERAPDPSEGLPQAPRLAGGGDRQHRHPALRAAPPPAADQPQRGLDPPAPGTARCTDSRRDAFYGVTVTDDRRRRRRAGGSSTPVLCRGFRCRSTPSPGSGAEPPVHPLHHPKTGPRKGQSGPNRSAVDRDRAVDRARFGRARPLDQDHKTDHERV